MVKHLIPTSSVNDGFTPKEILAAWSPDPLKKGGTLKPGQGVLDAGTILGRDTATKLLVAYNNAGSGGADTAVGILDQAQDTGAVGSTERVGCNIYLGGTFKRSALIGLDAGAVADLNGREDVNRDLFIF